MCTLGHQDGPHPGRAPLRRHRVRKPFIPCPARGPLAGLRDTKECAVTEKTKPEPTAMERTGTRAKPRTDELGSLEVWARSAPIRLAGYEDDLAEAHILPGID